MKRTNDTRRRAIRPLVIGTVSLCLLIILLTLLAYHNNSLLHFDGRLDKDFFPAFATFVGSLVGILLSGTSMILIYFTFASQQAQIKAESDVRERDYKKHIDEIRPVMDFQLADGFTDEQGQFLFLIKENSAYEFSLENLSKVFTIEPSVINQTYFNKNSPLKFSYKKKAGATEEPGPAAGLRIFVYYRDRMENLYKQSFTAVFEHRFFTATPPTQIEKRDHFTT